ncbi:MAG: TIM barrel protein [Planctomycetes bacterium]|nr:TIM barrel protein [Planctomycetota bacterium]
MDRRMFLAAGAAGLAVSATARATANAAAPARSAAPRGTPFHLRYAPHFGMFGNHAEAMEDQLQFAADEGFVAWEDNGMAKRSAADQEKLAAKMRQCGITMGVFVAHGDFGKPTFASGRDEHREQVLGDMRTACEVAKRVNARWCTVVPGAVDHRQDAGYQTANVVDMLKRCCDVIEAAGIDLTMVLEPLNFRDHPELFLTKIAQGFEICRAVGSPHCKILDDLYHQQVSEGNLIPNIDNAWGEIAYFQVGDNPGRREPGTGEINFNNVFRHIHQKGYAGIVGMEHGKAQGGIDGEKALIAAYRAADSF